jgi:cyclase
MIARFSAIALLMLAGAAAAQQDAPVTATDLGRNTWMLEGAGGNVTVAAGTDGVIMVDGQFAPMHPKLKAAVAAVAGQPIRYLVNTHFHGDHTGGNASFAADGVTVVSHANVARRLAAGTTNGLTGNKTPPVPKQAVPTKTYADRTTLSVKGRTARLGHPRNAHTDGDTYVYFADANVLATGDIVSLGRYPNIDFANGGTIAGMIAAVDGYIRLANERTKVVPGHGPLVGRAELVEYRALLAAARDRVAKLQAEGKSEKEAVDARPLADLDAKVKANPQASANFVRVIYNSLKPR